MMIEKNIPVFDPKIYTRIALNDLVTYSVYFLSQSGNEINAEDIVAACFLLFPKRFALRSYPQWPDSTVVNKRWVDCRNKGYIMGSTARGFSLTPKGLKLAERVSKVLGGQRTVTGRHGAGRVRAEIRTRAGRFVRAIEESDAYKLFQQKEEQPNINEFEFRSMLLCTMESSASTLRNNLEEFRRYATLYERKDILSFLDFCERKFLPLLTEGSQKSNEYRGGMLRRKIKK